MNKDSVNMDMEVREAHGVGMSANDARAMKEVEGAILLAKRFPRDEFASLQRIKKSCLRSKFAKDARYSFPRGGKAITGLSIYLAKEAARIWGNIQYGFNVMQDIDDSRTVEGWAWDMENNVRTVATATFKKLHQRKDRDGDTHWVVPNERDLRELTNKHGAICMRNAVLALLPSDFKADIMEQCQETLRGHVEKSRDDTIKRLVDAFDGFAITTKMIKQRYGYGVSELTADDLVELGSIYESIRDGHATRKDYFGKVTKQTEKAEIKLAKLSPAQELQKLAENVDVVKGDFDKAVELSGLPPEITECDEIEVAILAGKWHKAIAILVKKHAENVGKEESV